VPDQENLFVLACGPIPPNPAELLLDEKLSDLFAYLRQNFDVVIMDTAPAGMVSDAVTLSRYADSTLYIVRQGHTYKKQVAGIDSFYREGKLPKLSIILNDVKMQSGYGYYGRKNYGYGSGYFEEENLEPTFMQRWFGWLPVSKKKKLKKERI
jgi:Mrp family chromosome partitioning ATPase